MICTIKITDVHVASAIADKCENNYTAWVSLLDKDDDYLCERIKKSFRKKGVVHFHRYFSDIEEGPLADSHGPSVEDIEYIIDFFQTLKIQDKSHHVGINCYAGIARSATTGMIGWMIQGYQPEVALDKVLAVRPFAYPNGRILRLYDEIMGAESFKHIQDWKDLHRGDITTNTAWGY